MAFVTGAPVVGGGIVGMAAAIQRCWLGVAADLVDIDPDGRVYGAGIAITARRCALRISGVLDAVLAQAGAAVR